MLREDDSFTSISFDLCVAYLADSQDQERSFDSSSTTGPCVPICILREPSPERVKVGQLLLFNIRNLELVRAVKTHPFELDEPQLEGASHGWGLFSNRSDRSLLISDFLNPHPSKSKPEIIPLPTVTPINFGQTEVVCNMAMSSSPPDQDDQDWVVGIKFLGRQLSLCRPRRELRWTNILTPFESWESSKLMFSKKDQRFYLLAPGGNYLCSWDLNFKDDKKPKFHELVLLHNLPNIPRTSWKRCDSYCREDHWVESPSGECFLVKWYSEYSPDYNTDQCKLPMVMVFREEETQNGKKIMRYIEDIGDLCIFISKGEDFCVEASACPGLIPGSIFLNGRLFATLNISKMSLGRYRYPEGTPPRIPYSPYWLPPFSP